MRVEVLWVAVVAEAVEVQPVRSARRVADKAEAAPR
jgi:hypothetical protein